MNRQQRRQAGRRLRAAVDECPYCAEAGVPVRLWPGADGRVVACADPRGCLDRAEAYIEAAGTVRAAAGQPLPAGGGAL